LGSFGLRYCWERYNVLVVPSVGEADFTVAEKKRDLLDDLIDIQDDWQAVSNPLSGIADSLAEDPAKRKVFDPASYKEKPWANASRCLRCNSDRDDACRRCLDVCPTHAISIHKKAVNISEDDCRKCGLCQAVCPTETFNTRRHMAKQLYDNIARVASSYEDCYITCTRALKRIPKPNEICLPCVGMISRDLWFSILVDYTNVSVYLPLGICDRCRTTTGEQTYSDAIATAEEWAKGAVGLEVDEKDLTHEFTREYKRSQFVSSAIHATETVVTRKSRTLAGAQAVAKKVSDHAKRLDNLQRELENAVGAKSTSNRQRLLTQNRKLMMGGLQHDAELAKDIRLEVPVCDPDLCTACGDCVKACVTHAIDLDDSGRIHVQHPYCVNCGACAIICPENALTMTKVDATELVVVDKNAEEVARQKAKAKKEAKELMEKGKKQLSKTADSLEKLADDKD
jgi:Fe-S-cluster-containing hydrogenase component 2